MKRAVLLTVRGQQTYAGQEPEVIELVTEGTMEFRAGGWDISYEETELTGMAGTTTTFEVQGKKVILTRSGGVSSQMIFEEGKQHTSLYETPFGELPIDIQTSSLRHNLAERGGVMDIKYAIAVDHVVTGRNCFKLRVKRKI